jgi:predicted GNAT family acetyltransferase
MSINANEPEAEEHSPAVETPSADDSIDRVGEASRELFPASDSPAWAMGIEPDPSLNISNDQAENRIVVHIGGKTAFLAYRRMPGKLVLVHTEVPTEFAGHGIGSKLVRAGIEFATDYIRRHQEFLDLVHPDYRARAHGGSVTASSGPAVTM